MLVFRAAVTFALLTSSLHADKPKPRITVSKATTFLTQPLRKDGRVDYVAAFNRRYGKGVTPENNAAVSLWRAFGPGEIPAKLRAEFFRQLGIKPLPPKGPYFVDLYASVKNLKGRKKDEAEEALLEDFNAALEEPWKTFQYPEIAKWLAANKRPLEMLVGAARKPRFHQPMIAPGKRGMLFEGLGIPLAASSNASTLVEALRVRANLHLADGRAKKVARDLLACHRWARLIEQGPLLIASQRAQALEQATFQGERVLLRSRHFTSAKAIAYSNSLRQLGPLKELPEKIRFSERCFVLESVALILGGNPTETLLELLSDDVSGIVKAALGKSTNLHDVVDWNLVLKDVNHYFDRAAGIAGDPNRPQRQTRMAKLMDTMGTERRNARRLAELLRKKRPDRRALAKTLSVLLSRPTLQTFGEALASQARAGINFDLSQVALALVAFRRDNAEFPRKLAGLVPKYIPKLPPDRFSGQPLKYARDGKGYLLYSVGENGRDDGGEFQRPKADDIAIHVDR